MLKLIKVAQRTYQNFDNKCVTLGWTALYSLLKLVKIKSLKRELKYLYHIINVKNN